MPLNCWFFLEESNTTEKAILEIFVTIWEPGRIETLLEFLDQRDAGKYVGFWKAAWTSRSLEACMLLVVIDDAWKNSLTYWVSNMENLWNMDCNVF